MKNNRISFIISLTLALFFFVECKKNENNKTENLFLADIEYDLNYFLSSYSNKNIDSFYIEDSLRGKDTIKDLQFHYAYLLHFKKATVDSLYKNISHIFWPNTKFKSLDTMVYINSSNVIDPNSSIDSIARNKIILYVKLLTSIQKLCVNIREEIDKVRPGKKDEKIDCQNCKVENSYLEIEKLDKMSELYFETEKQFLIIYRELACTSFAIDLVNVKKVARKNYKVRI